MKWTSVVVLCALALIFLINIRDAKLKPEVTALLQRPLEDIPREENLFFAVMGFSAVENEDIHETGLRVLAAYEKFVAANGKQPSSFFGATGLSRLKFIGDQELLCDTGYGDDVPYQCIAKVKAGQNEIKRLLADNPQFLDRYQSLARYSNYQNPIEPRLDAPLPDWGDVMRGKRLWMSEIASRLNRGDVDASLLALELDMAFWRRVFGESHLHIVDKMIALASVRGNFMLAADILRQVLLTTSQYQTLHGMLTPFSPQERSLGDAFQREFLAVEKLYVDYAHSENPGLSATSIDEHSATGKALNLFTWRHFYQPNATINRHYDLVQKLIALDKKPCASFTADSVRIEQARTRSIGELVYNPVGNFLVSQTHLSTWLKYSRRICDLDGLRRMVGLQLLIKEQGTADKDIPALIERAGPDYADPYTGKPMHWDAEAKGLSFEAQDARTKKYLPWPM